MNFILSIKKILAEKQLRNSIILVIVFIVMMATFVLISTPYDKAPTIVHIGRGYSTTRISMDLKDKNVIRSEKVFKVFMKVFQTTKGTPVGDYYFNGEPVWKVAYMLSHGDHHIVPIKVTFPEGVTNEQMASILEKRLPNFNTIEFLDRVNGQQGYLFPDTYFFYPKTTTDEVIDALQSNYAKKIASLAPDFSKSNHSKKEIIIMASILEGEAKGEVDNSTISGILWKRLKNGMLLQVDAAKDTYKTKGLPNSPISNPGLNTIMAALHPVDSSYLFYLHDKSGVVHYATTFSEHKNNIKKYLK
jgi:UPF0755 protein